MSGIDVQIIIFRINNWIDVSGFFRLKAQSQGNGWTNEGARV
jgi:hypothetical protein